MVSTHSGELSCFIHTNFAVQVPLRRRFFWQMLRKAVIALRSCRGWQSSVNADLDLTARAVKAS